MQGGGDNGSRMQTDAEPLTPLRSRSVASSPFAAVQRVDQNPFSRSGSQNGSQSVEFSITHSKKLEDDIEELGQRIKHYEDSVEFLKSLNTQLDDQILNMEVTLGKIYLAKDNGGTDPAESEEEITNRILKHESSAAAFLCRLSNLPEAKTSNHPLTKDVLGIVATLGKVNDGNLGRLLSKYLGLTTMLGVVCRTSEGLKALKAYNKDGSVDESSGLHAFAASTGMPLDDNFRVYCLENLRPYGGGVIDDDLQRRLDLEKPILHGDTPRGFLGFAVNLIYIDYSKLFCVNKARNNLRETLFYHLFSSLQVYETRKDMLMSLPFIENGAISLDGGILRGTEPDSSNWEDVDVKFPGGAKGFLPQDYVEICNKVKEVKWKKTRTLDDLQRDEEQLKLAKFNYENKKKELVNSLAKASSVTQGGRRPSNPR